MMKTPRFQQKDRGPAPAWWLTRISVTAHPTMMRVPVGADCFERAQDHDQERAELSGLSPNFCVTEVLNFSP